ncbi:MAG: hypothetical protein M9894_34010 [Planctomycetes bacterium]|nr:hypothetical protein [Planctomycetota bacterium]
MPARDEGDDQGAFRGAAGLILAGLVTCAFLAWYPARSGGPPVVELVEVTEALRWTSRALRDDWLLAWAVAAMVLGAAAAPVAFFRLRGPRVARAYRAASAAALGLIPVVWWFCRPW